MTIGVSPKASRVWIGKATTLKYFATQVALLIDAVEAAIRLAVAKGWLRSDGDPASTVTLTVEGVKLIESKPGGPR